MLYIIYIRKKMASINSIIFTTSTNVNINGTPTVISNSTYYLKVTDMSLNTTIQNTTAPPTQVIVKLWADFSTTYDNIPSGQFIIDGSNITIDGQGVELDLSAETNYDGLVKSINANSVGIQLNNMNIKTGGLSTLSSAGGWVCQGFLQPGIILSFNNCRVFSNETISYNNNGSNQGGICGGNNLNNNLNFNNCSLIVNNGNLQSLNSNNNCIGGGICGGGNNFGTNTYTFTNCNVRSLTGNIINTHTINYNNWWGGICGGINIGNMIFTECIVEAYGSITIQSLGQTNWGGGICGGRNDLDLTGNGPVNYTFTNCQVNALNGDITLSGNVNANNFGGGICGGDTNANQPVGLSTFTFNLCFVNPSIGNFIYSGQTISKPNTNRTTLKNKIMIGQCDLVSQDQIQIDCVSQLLGTPDYSCNTEPLPPVPAPSNISPLGGGFQGFEPKMVVLVEGGGGRSMTRRILRDAFGTGADNKTRKCRTPFRISVNENCSKNNGKAPVIYSGSDYIRFKKLVAVNKNYNDSSFGGDNNNGSYDALKRARH
jgi:hypothetical protein